QALVSAVSWILILLILAKWAWQLWLDRLNRQHVLAHSGAVPEPFKAFIDEPTYAKSIQYTLERGRFHRLEITSDALILLFALWSGVLPLILNWVTRHWGTTPWAM